MLRMIFIWTLWTAQLASNGQAHMDMDSPIDIPIFSWQPNVSLLELESIFHNALFICPCIINSFMAIFASSNNDFLLIVKVSPP